MNNKVEAFRTAITILGGRRLAGEALGVTIQAIGMWWRDGCPPGRACEISDATGGRVGIEELLR